MASLFLLLHEANGVELHLCTRLQAEVALQDLVVREGLIVDHLVLLRQLIGFLSLLVHCILPFIQLALDHCGVSHVHRQILYIDLLQHLLIAASFDYRLLQLVAQ